MGLKENYLRIKNEVPDVCILAVSKYTTNDKILEAYQEGIRNFGEGKVQDAEKKRAELSQEIEKNIIWHFVGHLQTNKVKKIIGKYEFIHSVDTKKLAETISSAAELNNIKQKIFIQVNIAEEKQKYGFNKEEIKLTFGELLKLKNIEIVGLMTMAPFDSEEKTQRKVFKELRELRDCLQNEHKVNIPELSMGMSNDYKIAVEEGSTIIRVGTAIFNPEKPNNSRSQ